MRTVMYIARLNGETNEQAFHIHRSGYRTVTALTKDMDELEYKRSDWVAVRVQFTRVGKPKRKRALEAGKDE